MLTLLIVEDNPKLRTALKTGLEATGAVTLSHACGSGEEALAYCLEAASQTPSVFKNTGSLPEVILMDVQLAGAMNGIEAAPSAANSPVCRWFSTPFRMTTPTTATFAAPASSATMPTCANRITYCRR
jgi:CheY-like chemotaxis protein